jgi:hypothetical protein
MQPRFSLAVTSTVATTKTAMSSEAGVRTSTKAAVETAAHMSPATTEPAMRATSEIHVATASAVKAASRVIAAKRARPASIAATCVIAAKRTRTATIAVSVVIATAESVSTVAIAVVAAPAIPCRVETAIPAKAEGASDTKVGIGPPTPDPGRSQPRPAIAGVVDIGIGRSVIGRSFVGVLISVGHPNPPVLLGVDPLAATRRLMGHHRGC